MMTFRPALAVSRAAKVSLPSQRKGTIISLGSRGLPR